MNKFEIALGMIGVFLVKLISLFMGWNFIIAKTFNVSSLSFWQAFWLMIFYTVFTAEIRFNYKE